LDDAQRHRTRSSSGRRPAAARLGSHRSDLLAPGDEISLDGIGRLVVVNERAEGSEAVLDLVDRTLLGVAGPTPA
jgi:hypothetical protein